MSGNFNIRHLMYLTTSIAIGMVAFPMVINSANGAPVPQHARSMLVMGGAFVGTACFFTYYFLLSGQCEGCGRITRRNQDKCTKCNEQQIP